MPFDDAPAEVTLDAGAQATLDEILARRAKLIQPRWREKILHLLALEMYRRGARVADNLDCFFHELGVGGRHAALQIEVILQPHTHVPAQQDRLGDEGHLEARDGKARPFGALGQHLDHVLHRPGRRRRAVGNAQTELEQRRGFDVAVDDELLGEFDMAAVEDLELRLHA